MASLLGALLLLALPGITPGQTVDGTVCYTARDAAPKRTYTVTAGGQTCRIKAPARMACLIERAAPITPAPPFSSILDSAAPTELCYRARCRPTARRPATLADAFGSRGVTLRAARFLCLPAGGAETIVTTTTVPGGVTTTTRPPRECGFLDGECGGGCPQGQRCSIAVDGCKCRSTTCGNADEPACEGSCPTSDETCVFVLTGCECVDLR